MNAQQQWDQWDEFVETIDVVMAETGIRSRMDAADEVRRRYPHLRNAKYPGKPGITMSASSGGRSTGTTAGGGNADAELERRARQYQSEHPGTTFAMAYTKVLNADPDLYLRYLRQKQAEIEAASRRA